MNEDARNLAYAWVLACRKGGGGEGGGSGESTYPASASLTAIGQTGAHVDDIPHGLHHNMETSTRSMKNIAIVGGPQLQTCAVFLTGKKGDTMRPLL